MTIKCLLGAIIFAACYCGALVLLLPPTLPVAPSAPVGVDYELPSELSVDDCALRKDCVSL